MSKFNLQYDDNEQSILLTDEHYQEFIDSDAVLQILVVINEAISACLNLM